MRRQQGHIATEQPDALGVIPQSLGIGKWRGQSTDTTGAVARRIWLLWRLWVA